MYKKFYHLKENPFNVTSDPDFFFFSARHAEAFSHLVYGISERKGILVITGEIGAGKTTLCRTLLNRLDEKTKTALILNPSFSDIQLLKFILKDLGIEGKFQNKFAIIEALNKFLLEQSNLGHNVAIIIDEAQNLKPQQLEQIRLLSNLETEKEKLLQIILVGQPELVNKLKLPSLTQLDQRVSVRYHIMPLKQNEIADYINHRLKIASGTNNPNPICQFKDDAIEKIYKETQGIPRKINILCDRVLLAGYTKEIRTFDKNLIEECIADLYSVK
ncbi:MAG TPA: AAA family ATPase [Candidatus Omnitrophota bacterium]|nr:AAA family ATPase [Candidatus Omnitrophota bacterium]